MDTIERTTFIALTAIKLLDYDKIIIIIPKRILPPDQNTVNIGHCVQKARKT